MPTTSQIAGEGMRAQYMAMNAQAHLHVGVGSPVAVGRVVRWCGRSSTAHCRGKATHIRSLPRRPRTIRGRPNNRRAAARLDVRRRRGARGAVSAVFRSARQSSERACFPLEWQDEPFHTGLAGNSFAKVLVRYRPEWQESAQGRADAQAPRAPGVVPARADAAPRGNHHHASGEDEREFEEQGRPTLLAALIRESYRRGLVPDLWKIEGTSSTAGAAIVDVAIRERPEPGK